MEGYNLSPSLLSADFASLEKAIAFIEEKKAFSVHIDVMDGSYVPEISYGEPIIRSIRRLTRLPFDVHLMVERPEEKVKSFIAAGADWLTFHPETCRHPHRLISAIQNGGAKAGIAILPGTRVEEFEELYKTVDLVLVMSVNPGFGGQKIIHSCVEKIAKLKRLREEMGLDFKISVDGGVNSKTIEGVKEADIIVSGSAFFSGELFS